MSLIAILPTGLSSLAISLKASYFSASVTRFTAQFPIMQSVESFGNGEISVIGALTNSTFCACVRSLLRLAFASMSYISCQQIDLALPQEGTRYIIRIHTNGFACCADLLQGQEYIKTGPTAEVDDYFTREEGQDLDLCPMTTKSASFNPAIARGFLQLSPRLAPFGTLLRSSSEYPKDAATVDSYFPSTVPREAALYRSLTAR